LKLRGKDRGGKGNDIIVLARKKFLTLSDDKWAHHALAKRGRALVDCRGKKGDDGS